MIGKAENGPSTWEDLTCRNNEDSGESKYQGKEGRGRSKDGGIRKGTRGFHSKVVSFPMQRIQTYDVRGWYH